MKKRSIRTIILDAVSDLAMDFAYYDRKKDEDLSRDDLHDAITNNVVTIDEIVNRFRSELLDRFK